MDDLTRTATETLQGVYVIASDIDEPDGLVINGQLDREDAEHLAHAALTATGPLTTRLARALNLVTIRGRDDAGDDTYVIDKPDRTTLTAWADALTANPTLTPHLNLP